MTNEHKHVSNTPIHLARQSLGRHTLLLPGIAKQYHLEGVLLGSRRRIRHGGHTDVLQVAFRESLKVR